MPLDDLFAPIEPSDQGVRPEWCRARRREPHSPPMWGKLLLPGQQMNGRDDRYQGQTRCCLLHPAPRRSWQTRSPFCACPGKGQGMAFLPPGRPGDGVNLALRCPGSQNHRAPGKINGASQEFAGLPAFQILRADPKDPFILAFIGDPSMVEVASTTLRYARAGTRTCRR